MEAAALVLVVVLAAIEEMAVAVVVESENRGRYHTPPEVGWSWLL